MLTIDKLFKNVDFTPNDAQRESILHVANPLFLVAGPGSGKTRVLLWRTLNLIVFHGTKPEEIYLSTFTEKAATQLKEGLLSLLGMASNETGVSYDISEMYVGTVHSLCQRLITDRRFAEHRSRKNAPILLDALDQYFHVQSNRFWNEAKVALNLPDDLFQTINSYLISDPRRRNSQSKHHTVTNSIQLFNRFSEENLSPDRIEAAADSDELRMMASLYRFYLDSLNGPNAKYVDFSLLQQEAYTSLLKNPDSGNIFKHVIIDEYQDTNAIQEKIFFQLAHGNKNICVVGDDDQALYRFRGATVENFVQFPERCQKYLSTSPKTIKLNTNYRSRKAIVDFYSEFIDQENWVRNLANKLFYRLADKDIKPHSDDIHPAVVTSSNIESEQVAEQVADFVAQLIVQKKVADPNQIAFLFPSLQSVHARRMKRALENRDIRVYAPRAGRFLECEEPTAIIGLFIKVFGKPERREYGGDYKDFYDWLDSCNDMADCLFSADKQLAHYVNERNAELKTVFKDYQILTRVLKDQGWNKNDHYDPDKHKRALASVAGLSDKAKRSIGGAIFDKIAKKRIQEGNPFKISYIVNRATSPDWNVLDLFYRLAGFSYFKAMFDLAENGHDEGPVCNLGLTSQYLARFIDKNSTVITASFLEDNKFQNTFFGSYLYAIFRLGESEYEDAEDPFPKGRIPFLTIHQSKGLEFPVVVLGNPNKDNRGPQRVEELVRPFLEGDPEPLERIGGFDIMRMFYVALSRAKNLLVVAHPQGRGVKTHFAFKSILDKSMTTIPKFDFDTLPPAKVEVKDISKSYSYTSDYLAYQKCARQYMLFRKYGFSPSRSQTMFFGSLVHYTLEDLHNRLIANKGAL